MNKDINKGVNKIESSNNHEASPLLEFFSKVINLDDNERDIFKTKLIKKRLKKGDILYNEGDITRHLHFIISGMARSYLMNLSGRDFTWGIFYNGPGAKMRNLFVTDYASFVKQEPTRLIFEIIEDTELESISYKNLNDLFDSSITWQSLGRQMADNAYHIAHHRVFSLLSEKAEDRYMRLIDDNPFILDIIPHYIIASYLGIAPQSLSRIRAKLQLFS